jgi:hypothetical protein
MYRLNVNHAASGQDQKECGEERTENSRVGMTEYITQTWHSTLMNQNSRKENEVKPRGDGFPDKNSSSGATGRHFGAPVRLSIYQRL